MKYQPVCDFGQLNVTVSGHLESLEDLSEWGYYGVLLEADGKRGQVQRSTNNQVGSTNRTDVGR